MQRSVTLSPPRGPRLPQLCTSAPFGSVKSSRFDKRVFFERLGSKAAMGASSVYALTFTHI